jgi:hypothetical protein
MTVISKKDKLITLATFVSLGISFLFLILLIVWSVYPYRPLVVNNHPYPVLTRQVKQGGILIFEMDYCKYTDNEVTISRRFIDGLIYTVSNLTAYNPRGCRKVLITEDIPQNLPSGEYVMSFNYTYEVNPIRRVTVTAHTQKFEVIE